MKRTRWRERMRRAKHRRLNAEARAVARALERMTPRRKLDFNSIINDQKVIAALRIQQQALAMRVPVFTQLLELGRDTPPWVKP
jgi:hypothetical protein